MYNDIYYQTSSSMALLMDNSSTAGNWATGITNDYRSYNPSNSKFTNVATTRAGSFNPQKSFANFIGPGRYTSYAHFYSNSAQYDAASSNQINYLAPSSSRPSAYYWAQHYSYTDPTKGVFSNQSINGLSFYRLSDGSKVIVDQMKNTNRNWLWYNETTLDNNLLTLSNAGAISKIEGASQHQDNTTNPTTPILFQTHGGMPANATTTWRTDHARDSYWQADDRDTYIWYRPNYGSNKQLPTEVETMGEWHSNLTGGRSGS